MAYNAYLEQTTMDHFVNKDSIVREIWGNADTILVIFAGAAAEFALNKAVDWLYFTGKLPADPLGRLFSTVTYAREIVFSEKQAAIRSIEKINAIHSSVEATRAEKIPDWAYRDVLFMLIDYSVRAYELLQSPLKMSEKNEVLEVFTNVGTGMNLKDLPEDFESFRKMRISHLQQDLEYSDFSKDLFKQYRHHLGETRYRILLETQALIVPAKVRQLLKLRNFSILHPLLPVYKLGRSFQLDRVLKEFLLPKEYKEQIKALDFYPG